MDKFHEQLLKTHKNMLYKILSAYMYISLIIVIMTAGAAMSGAFAVLVLTAIFGATCFGSKILRDRQYKEFEYILTNGNLQIDVIYNMKKRKVLYDIDIKDIEEFGKSEEIKISAGTKKVICFPWDNESDKYTVLLNTNERQAVFIAPDNEILKLIKLYNVRRPKL